MTPLRIILTGGHSGIGLELSKMLLAEGHHLGLIVRSISRKADTLAILGRNKAVDFFVADLSLQSEVVRVAAEIEAKWSHIDVLFNNAGVLLEDLFMSPQENEMHFEVNTLSPFLLTRKLEKALRNSAQPIVINTVTGGQHTVKTFDAETLKQPERFKKLFGPYMQSKYALSLMMNHLAETWPKVRIVNVDPGPNKTKMTAGNGMPGWLVPLRNLFFSRPQKGAKLLYQAAFDPSHGAQSGVYLSGNKVKPLRLRITEAQREKILSSVNRAHLV
ncbi:MAG: SDR family NAD(P)-dependent oxidoreductase [Bacteroidota bacterium]